MTNGKQAEITFYSMPSPLFFPNPHGLHNQEKLLLLLASWC